MFDSDPALDPQPEDNSAVVEEMQKKLGPVEPGGITGQGASDPLSVNLNLGAGGGYGNAPPGFDQGKWADPNKHDPKYDVGRALAGHPNDPEGSLAEIRQRYADANLTGDSLDIPSQGIHGQDVLYGLKGGAWQPQWLDPNDQGGGAAPGGQDFGPMTSGAQGIAGGLQGLIQQLMGGGSLNNSFITDLLKSRLQGQGGMR